MFIIDRRNNKMFELKRAKIHGCLLVLRGDKKDDYCAIEKDSKEEVLQLFDMIAEGLESGRLVAKIS